MVHKKLNRRTNRKVELSVERWRAAKHSLTDLSHFQQNASLEDVYSSPPPKMQPVKISKNNLRTLNRFFVWVYAILMFSGGTLWDLLLRKDTLERRAVRLRQILQGLGGTFVKVGQQLAMRVDIIPYPYCVELSKLLDKLPPFSTDYAIRVIERVTGQPLVNTFPLFDPEPIGSASIACVYQASFADGKKVAIKIRRPNIGELFISDCQILDFLLICLEFLTIIRPGTTYNLRADLRHALLEEIDFRKEARYQEIFCNTAKNSKYYFISSPQVYFNLLSEDLLVSEFVFGVSLIKILKAIESNNQDYLEYLKQLNIDPTIVARRIAWANNWGRLENIIFHADPHPANIIVRPDNQIVFIDFGACGMIDERLSYIALRMNYCFTKNDIRGMVQAAVSTLEPLPPIDINQFLKELEISYWQLAFAFQSKHSEWWERTSISQWLVIMELARKYQIPMSRSMLTLIRATLLYDTLVTRLDRNLDAFHEFNKYARKMWKRARKRVEKRIRKVLNKNEIYYQFEDFVNLGNMVLYRIKQLLDSPNYNLIALIDKGSYAVVSSIVSVSYVLIITSFIIVNLLVINLIQGQEINIEYILIQIIHNRLYQVFILLLFIINIRRIMFRLQDREF